MTSRLGQDLGDVVESLATRVYNVEQRTTTPENFEGGTNEFDEIIIGPTGDQVVINRNVDAPANLVLTPGFFADTSYVDVNWDPPLSGEFSYFEVLVAEKQPDGTYILQNIFTTPDSEVRATGLTPNRNYGIRVRSVNRIGDRSNSVPVAPAWEDFTSLRDTTPPPQVTGVVASPTIRSIIVEWEESTATDVQVAEGLYEVQLDRASTFNSAPLGLPDRQQRVSATVAAFAELTPNTQYFVRVRAIDSSSNEGPWSLTDSAITRYVEQVDLGPGSVHDTHIQSNAVTTAKIAAGAVDTGKLATAAVDSTKLSDGSVLSAKLADLSVSLAKIADGAVGSAKVADGAVLDTKLATGAVTSVKLADLAVTAAKLANGTVGYDKMESGLRPIESTGILPVLPDASYPEGSVVSLSTDGKLYRNVGGTWTASVPTVDLTGQIASGQIENLAITETKIADNSVTTPKLIAGAVVASKISAGAIETDKLAASAVTANKIAANTITASEIAANTITAAQIAVGAITADELAANAVTANKIRSGEINSDHITVVGLDAGVIKTGTLDAGRVTVGVGSTYESGYDPTTKATPEYVQSRGENLVTNGSGLLGDNTNFAGFDFNPADKVAGGGSFEVTSGSITRVSDEFIPVDPNTLYLLSGYFKNQGAEAGRFYFGFVCYDADRVTIITYYVAYTAGTETTLAQPLAPGDTQIVLTDSANWRDNMGAGSHYHSIALYPYTDGKGYTYDPYTYTRHYQAQIWDDLAIDRATHTITLNRAFNLANPDDPNGVWPAGTPVANNHSGGGYNYNAASNQVAPADWTLYSGEIDGLAPPGTYPYNKLRQGTSFIRLLFLLNRNTVAASTTTGVSVLALQSDPEGAVRRDYGHPNDITLIDGGRIFTDSVTANAIAANTITAFEINANAITASELAAGAVLAEHITAGEVVAGKLAAGAVEAGNIAAGAVTAGTVAANVITATQIDTGAVTAIKIATDAVVAAKIQAGAITTIKLDAGAVTADKITAGAVTTVKLDAGAVTADKITAGAVTTTKLDAGAVTADKLSVLTLSVGQYIEGNYVAGSSGWRISGDGAVEIQNLYARGTFTSGPDAEGFFTSIGDEDLVPPMSGEGDVYAPYRIGSVESILYWGNPDWFEVGPFIGPVGLYDSFYGEYYKGIAISGGVHDSSTTTGLGTEWQDNAIIIVPSDLDKQMYPHGQFLINAEGIFDVNIKGISRVYLGGLNISTAGSGYASITTVNDKSLVLNSDADIKILARDVGHIVGLYYRSSVGADTPYVEMNDAWTWAVQFRDNVHIEPNLQVAQLMTARRVELSGTSSFFRIADDTWSTWSIYSTFAGAFVAGLTKEGHMRTSLTAAGSPNYGFAENGNTGVGYDPTPAVAFFINGNARQLARNDRFIPKLDNQQYLGDSARRWIRLYATTSTIATSDARDKTQIGPDIFGLDFLRKLRPVSYRWSNQDDDRPYTGFIGQEVDKVLGEADMDWGGIERPDPENPESRYGLAYTELIGPLVAAVQELAERLERAEAKLAS